ncbi:hypothetical protein T310_9861, partial [Rasamsonia emersonii CBS 393.64]
PCPLPRQHFPCWCVPPQRTFSPQRTIFTIFSILCLTTMPKSPDKIESLIEEALRKASCQKKPNISALAREFDVPRGRLRERFKGRPPKNSSYRA